MVKKKAQSNLKPSEETIIAIGVISIFLMGFTTLGLLVFFYAFIPVLAIDFIVLIRKKRIPETPLRLLILVNVVAAAASIYFILGSNVPSILN